MIAAAQTRAIHALKRNLGMTDGDYRGLLKARFKVVSSTDLSSSQAGALIEELKGLATPRRAAGRSLARTATGRYAKVLQAFWIAGWHLGVVHAKDDAAMLAFVERQTGLPHTRFLTDPADATRAIEGMKAWLAREAKIVWPDQRDADREGRDISWLRKRAVAHACAVRLQQLGAFTPVIRETSVWPQDVAAYGYRRGLPAGFDFYSADDWNRLSQWLGGRLRAALAKKRGEA
ncbi:MAG: regulatory protein GemA [Roseiarcus sp.]